MLLLGAAVVVIGTLVTVYWWRQDRSPAPLSIWLAFKALLWTKTALKIGVAAGIGIAALRQLRNRRRRAATAGAELEPEPKSTAASPT
jgi:hypothetical protein